MWKHVAYRLQAPVNHMLVEASFLMSEYVLVEALHVNKLINVDTRLSIHDSLGWF